MQREGARRPATKRRVRAGTLCAVIRRLLIVFAALCVFATSCGQASMTETATAEPTRDIATTTAIPIPTATPVPPTATAVPTATAEPTVTPAPLPTPTETPTPIPTPPATEVAIEPTAEPTPEPTVEPSSEDSSAAAETGAAEAQATDEGSQDDGVQDLSAQDDVVANGDDTASSDSGEGDSGDTSSGDTSSGDTTSGDTSSGEGDGGTTASSDAAAPEAVDLPKPAGQGVLPAAYELSSIQAVGCPSGAQDAAVSCFSARVPAAADRPSADAMINLMVSVVDNGDPNGVGPVVYLQGGPGVGSVLYADRYVGLDHDVVLVDQRGNGSSTPQLGCEEVDALWVAERIDDAGARLEDLAGTQTVVNAYAACVERLEASGIDLNLFDTTNAADDFALVRQLLGYPEWSLWGVSYGTRLGLTIMRDHPEGVKAAVLDSVVPFEVDFWSSVPANGLRSMTAVSDACNATTCGAEHGDFLTNLGDLARRLDSQPVVLTATRPVSGQQFRYRIDGQELLSMVFTQLYSTDRLRALPRQVARADFGGLEELLARYVSRRDPEAIDLALGSYYATWCSEEFPFYDHTRDNGVVADATATFGSGFAPALSSDGVNNVCSKFNVRSAPAIDDQPLVSSIPTLVMAGSLDPITPPSWSRQVADALTQSFYVELADHGHGMTGSCAAGIRVQFLATPSAAPDTSCADAITGPTFE